MDYNEFVTSLNDVMEGVTNLNKFEAAKLVIQVANDETNKMLYKKLVEIQNALDILSGKTEKADNDFGTIYPEQKAKKLFYPLFESEQGELSIKIYIHYFEKFSKYAKSVKKEANPSIVWAFLGKQLANFQIVKENVETLYRRFIQRESYRLTVLKETCPETMKEIETLD